MIGAVAHFYSFAVVAEHKHVVNALGQLAYRHVKRKAVHLGKRIKVHLRHCGGFQIPAAYFYCALS